MEGVVANIKVGFFEDLQKKGYIVWGFYVDFREHYAEVLRGLGFACLVYGNYRYFLRRQYRFILFSLLIGGTKDQQGFQGVFDDVGIHAVCIEDV